MNVGISADVFSAENIAIFFLAFLAGCLVTSFLLFDSLRRLRFIERALRERERQFRKVVDSSSDMIGLYDINLVLVYVTPSCKDVVGFAPEEVIGTRLPDYLHPDDAGAVAAMVTRLMTEGGMPLVVVRTRHRDKGWIWVEAAARLIVGDAGQPDLFYVATRDITERVRMEQELAARERKMRAIIDRALDPIIGVDDQGNVVEWNHAAEATFGWSQAEITGQSVTRMFPAERRERLSAGVRTLLAGDMSAVASPVETRLVCEDGHQVPVEMTLWSVEEADRWLLMSIIRDISVRKETEDALISAREQALEAARLKSEFLATMSHEIRTPMNGVIGMSELLMDTPLSDVQEEYANGIAKAGQALLQVINDILDFSKLEAGKMVIEEVTFRAGELIDDVIDLVAGSARAKGLELIGYVAPEVPPVLYGDPGRLRQVLLNLASNAIKFTEHGEVVVRVSRASKLEEPDDAAHNVVWLRFAVIDTGTGISKEAQHRIFGAFTQADSSTTRKFGGTGLGLAISQKIVEAMHGRISVESELGEGSTFSVEVPLRRSLVSAEPQAPAGEPELAGSRVLIVDDNATNRMVLERQLGSWEVAPTAVDGAEPALAALHAAQDQGEPFNAVILDMVMPGMDGLQLAQKIIDDPDLPPARLILMSSAGQVDLATARAAGLMASLTKPVHAAQLRTCVAGVLARKPGEIEAPAPAKTGAPAPKAAGEKAEAAAGEGAEAAAGGAPAAADGTRVLLAEDNEINQKVGVAMLTRLGYHTDLAGTGAEALRLIETARSTGAPYDAVLMDMLMPEMDGLVATAELRRQEGTRWHTPVIALTAAAREEDRQRCLAAGMDDFVSKPFTKQALGAVLGRWTSEDKGSQGNGGRDDNGGDDNGDDNDIAGAIERRIGEIRDPAGGDEEIIRTLLDSILRRVPESMGKMSDLVAGNDAEALATEAHTLKGAAANLGVDQVASVCAELVAEARAGRLDSCGALLERLDDAYRAAAPVILRMRDSLPQPASGGGAP